MERYGKDSKPMGGEYYSALAQSAAVKAGYNNNRFDIQTLGISELEIKINPKMVDLTKPVKVIVNGHQLYNGTITADKAYLVDNFKQTFDRDAL